MIEQRLRRRVLDQGMDRVDTYLQALLDGRMPETELRHVIDLITTNTTSFFREAEHFDFLRKAVLPELAVPVRGKRPRLKFWSAASSEGAEAYTTAIVLAEAVRSGLEFDWAILGTDLSRRMLEKASVGIYDREMIEVVPPVLARRYFMSSQDSRLKNKLRVVPELRARVRFRHLNLMDQSYPVDRDVNVIFLRNILIYFDAEDKAAVVERITSHLAPGGYLIVGHSESMIVRSQVLQQVQPTIFRKAPQ